ncbi:threonine-phosphate decarboxylase [Sporosarcina sp. FSL K6-1522]|uniref:pyridoxal phosphate-dependent aminotransferase n=1 Tax=Sporosarcina sp. FSL K6-1522 TaxID=2921554 RepID=UPI00315AE2F6
MQLPEHGANPHQVYAKLGMDVPERILDVSENVNPAGPPQAVLEMWPRLVAELASYPDPDGEPFLSAVADFHSVPSSFIVAGNGAAELLALVAERYRGKRAVVVHPTFSEYEATLLAKQVEIVRVVASEAEGFTLPLADIYQAMESSAVLYLCTPNNPTGMLPEREVLRTIIRHGAQVGCEVVLDEAFIDFVDESRSFIAEIKEFPHVIIVRSMTKMYAIPGIRLGYVVAHPTIIAGVKALAPHWNVNGMAARVGAVCLQQEAFRQQAIQHATVERGKMTAFLQEHGCTVTDSVANFLTFKLGTVQATGQLYRDLLARGIVLRHSENFRGMDGRWLRVGMKSEDEMIALREELTRWFAEN